VRSRPGARQTAQRSPNSAITLGDAKVDSRRALDEAPLKQPATFVKPVTARLSN
jgi:hypothetical protein